LRITAIREDLSFGCHNVSGVRDQGSGVRESGLRCPRCLPRRLEHGWG
jgi:hypothetical protein